jgi:hypothetical protein
MKKIWIGLEGAGKDLHFAYLIEKAVLRNVEWKKKYGIVRPIATSQPLSEKFENWIKEKEIPIIYVKSQSDIAKLNGCDLFIPELAVFFDARSWESMPLSLRIWLSQQSKRGVHFYGASQNFEQIDVSFRRLIPKNCLYEIIKFIGSPRPGANLPEVKNIWGIYFVIEIEFNDKMEKKRNWLPLGWLNFHFIQKKYTSLFNTNAITEIEYAPYEHYEKICPDCDYKKTIHK